MSAIPANANAAPPPFLLACASSVASADDWRPDGGDDTGARFVWSVAAVTTRGELVYQRVSAGNYREAVSAARCEITDVARIVGASPVSL